MRKKGIDISYYQRSMKDIERVKSEGIEFTIIKIGEYYTHKDSVFDQHYALCHKAKLPTGVYLFSHAETVESVEREARFALDIMAGRPLQLPMFLDIEAEDSCLKGTRENALRVARRWCELIEEGGYMAGIYASASPWKTHLSTSECRENRRCVWVANYQTSAPHIDYYDIWQYADTEKVAGIVTDTNYLINAAFMTGAEDDTADSCDDSRLRSGSTEPDYSRLPLLTAAAHDDIEHTAIMHQLLLLHGYATDKSCGFDAEALRSWQREHGLDADACCGPITWKSLIEEEDM